jgi:hypothetical protein
MVRGSLRQARASLARRADPPQPPNRVPLDDQPAEVIADLARRLAGDPPTP